MICVILVYLYHYHQKTAIDGFVTIFAAGIFLPVIIPAIDLGWRRAKPYFPSHSGIQSARSMINQKFNQLPQISLISIGFNRYIRILDTLSKINQDIHNSHLAEIITKRLPVDRWFHHELPEETHSFISLKMVYLPIITFVVGIILHIFFIQLRVYQEFGRASPEGLFGIITGAVFAFVYKAFLQGFLPKTIQPPDWLTMFFTLSTSVEFMLFFPNKDVLQSVMAFQIIIFLLYIWTKSGTSGGTVPLIIGFFLGYFAESVRELFDYIADIGLLTLEMALVGYSILTFTYMLSVSIVAYGIYIHVTMSVGKVPKGIRYIALGPLLYVILYIFSYLVGFVQAYGSNIIASGLLFILATGRILSGLIFIYGLYMLRSDVYKWGKWGYSYLRPR